MWEPQHFQLAEWGNYQIQEVIQGDGRIRRWGPIDEMGGKYLRVILLPDRETVHNAFFDRSFMP